LLSRVDTIQVTDHGFVNIGFGDRLALFTPAGLGQLKHAFLAGAVLSLIGLFTKSPLTPRPASQQVTNQRCEEAVPMGRPFLL
jgi:hypothetical protein